MTLQQDGLLTWDEFKGAEDTSWKASLHSQHPGTLTFLNLKNIPASYKGLGFRFHILRNMGFPKIRCTSLGVPILWVIEGGNYPVGIDIAGLYRRCSL